MEFHNNNNNNNIMTKEILNLALKTRHLCSGAPPNSLLLGIILHALRPDKR